ncbi:non-ribosomal peptide synthase/polyketide synthase [Burkholderia pseudomallei]|uniref:non-ribosomal peptide synthase/polyketide synthase n=306 Tax=Burkholderia pseudomallei TaxID=28450 RepID=UPI0039C858AA
MRIPPNLIADGDEHITPAQLTLVALSQESIDALVTKVEGGAANVQDIYPLAPLQEGILFHHLMSGESDPYVLSGVLAFRGREVMERFVSALQQVIDRHDILRTGFFWEGLEQPVQVVQRRATLPVSVVELDAGEGDIVRQLEARFDSRGYRMDVSRAPLMHVHAACDGEHERWVARVLFHHLSIDHTTLERVIEEARAIGQGRVEDLPRPAPFRNFVAQARLGVSEADHEAYFRAKLGDIDEPTAPFGLLSVQGDGREIAEAARTLKPELSGALRGHARRLGVSAASMMHVAWGLVLSRTTGRQDVVFGTVLFGRMQGGAQSDRALGLFINTLPVRMRVAQTGVEASVKGTHAQLAELMRHEHAPLVLAQRCSGVPAQTPLFTSLLNYRYSKPKVAAAHIADGIELLDGHERTSYPLSVTVDDHERDFTIVAKVCERIGPQRVCELMELALEQLTRALSANPGGELAELDVLPAAERTQVLHGWNETGRAYARDACLHQLFEAQVSRTREAAAVICGDETLSYTDLDARANRLAHYLRGQGVGPDTRVGLALGRGVEMMTGLLAILKAGGAYVPLDPGYASERLRAILDDSRPAIVLADAAGRTALDALAGAPPIADLHADASRWSALPSTPPRVEGLTPRHLAYVIYTSGSTGQPKGVMVEHASVVNLWRALDEAIYRTHPSARRVSLNASIAFDSLVKQWVQLLSGRTLVVVPEPVRFDGRRLLDAIGRDRIDVFDCTPSQLALIEGARGPEDEAYPQVTLVGGEAIGEGMWSELASASSRTYYNVYGPTECTVDATLARITAEHAPHIGGPLANVRAYVLNERLSPAPVGVRGELYIGGAGVARGYLNRPELTRERFIDDPFVAGGRLYKTGDLARWRTDGSLEYLGRNDFQVKIRGFRIELGEIEAQLAKVTGVREVVVLARDSAAAVHDSATEHATPNALSPSLETSTATAAATATATATEKRLVAYYTGDADVAALRAQAAQHLPSYMVPSAYVRLDAWPLTPNGKLDRRALPAPADDAYARAEYEAPRGAKEEALAEIWRELLHVERVSRHDNFFELGGHSLLAVQLVSRLRQALSVEVALGTVFDAPVLSALAERLEAENTAVLPPIPLAPRDGRIALSLAQQRLWFLTQLEGVSEAYHMSGAVRLDGPLNREVLQRALNRIVMRHEALRTCFAREEGEPIQVIQPHADLTVSYHDLREAKSIRHEAENREQRAKDLSQAHASAPFDLSRDLPVRVLLLQLADEAHVVQVVMHHIASDGWSVGVFLQELSALYGSFIAEQGDPLAPLPLQYADYAAWQRRWLASGQLEKQGAFWQTNLSGAPTLLELPTDRPRPPKQSHAGASVEVKLGAALSERVKRLSQRHGVTPYMTLLSSWAAVLSRLSGQEEVVIGSPVAGRNRTEVEALIGFFVNTLALRLDLSSEPTVGELLKRTKAQVLSAQAHQDLPFDQVVERVKPPRSTAHPPLFQVMFVWQNMPAGELTIPGLTIRAVETPLQTAQFELTLSLREAGDDIVGHLNYASALFDESTVRRYVTYWRRLLEGMTAGAADQTIVGLPLLDEAERKQVVYAWNATERDYPIEQCIHQLFEAQVDRKPEAIALTFEGQRLSYAELNARANRLAHYLQGRGVGPDRLVALCAERGIEMVVGLLAILKAGGAYVPLDPAYASDRLRGIVEDSQPALVLADAVGRAALGELDGALPVIDLETDALRWREMPATNPEVASQHVHHLAYVIYTSGSTGRPKGVMVEHAQVVRLFGATQAWFGFDERDVWTLFHSHGFDFSVWEMWGALLHGGRLVIVPTEVTRTPSAFFALLCAEGVTVLNQTPSAFQALMSAQEEREEAAGNIERANVVAHRLRYVIFGGEALEPRTLASWYARHGERTQLVNMYGITETTVHVTYCALRAEDAMRLGASPIGVRIPDLQLYVLDARREPVPMGVTGELYVGGAGVARGYLNRPELTRERFIDDPFVAGGRLYKTGDLARWRTDGSLEYLGRNDFQVKIRGFRIELGEIEAQLAKVTGVREVVVLARDSAAEMRDNATPNAPMPKSSSETEKRLVAYYTGDADVAALRAQAAQHLPSYMVPSAYVRLDAWPLTPNGKLDRRALPAPADDAYARAEYEAPQGAKEEALAAIWRELLHVERVSRHDNFFELGGHSLLAIGVIERMRREGLHTDVRSIFNAQTLSDLAARAQTDDRSIQAPPNLIPARATRITPDMLPLVALTQTQIDMLAVQVEGGAANIQDIYPLAPLQEGMVFHHLLHAESDAYMEAYFVGFRTRARLDRFLDALRMIVDRHDILRTGFFWEGLEQPVQIVQRRVRLPIEFVDLDPADGDVLRQLEARHDPRAHRLDIRRPALLSCHAAHDPAAGRWLLCVMAHHLAIDNTSLKLLVAEEQAIEQGGFDALPPAPSFRNFIAQIASGVDRREHEAFFSAMLGDIDSPTHPFGLQDVQGDGREIAEFQQRLSPELSKAIRVCTRRLGVSPASLMHLAWAMVLSRATGRREAVFGTVLFGRMQGGERGMGMFINTLPIRIDVDERYVAECLAHTHERVVQLIYHEHAPLALALRCSGLPARQALFSSLLNYRHSEQAARPPRDDDDIQYLDGNERTNYPLTVSIDDLGEAFSVTVQARHPASPERIRAFMETALEQLVRALDGTSGIAAPGVVMPRIAVRDIDVLPSEERHRLLVEWNDTAADYPQDQCLHRLFEAQAARHPDTIALIADGEPVGYAELNRRANRLARHLSARGLQPDQRVAICIDRGIDMVVAMLAVLKAGGAYVPLDPAYPSERLDYLLRDCAPVALLTHARLGASMQTRIVLALARLDTGCALIDLESDADAWRHERDDDPPPSGLTPRHLAYVIYTSGSTGQPKGVMVEHRSVCNLVAWHAGAFDVGTGCRSASVAGVAFDATTWEVWAALCNGGCLSLAPGDAASDPQALLRWWRAQELDVGFLVTPLAELAYATGQSNAGMRTLLIGGDRLSRWPDSMPPGQMLVNNYGPTEATVVATSGRLQPGEATPPIGRPIANTRVYVLDAWLRPAPIGVAGELYIGGVQVARGYLNRPELTRERFIDDPFVAGGRLYKTGDLARWRTDGSLEYLGRNDFQVKIRGFRIELGEIEAQLAKVAGVREVVVLARDSAAEVHDSATEHATPNALSPSPETSTATAAATATATATEKRLVAYYKGDADVAALRAQAAQHLPSYMVPSAYVRLDAWPLTPNGKLDRRALPAPADDAYARAEYEAPQGAKEEALAAIWRELLHVERVSRHDNFFELGGHSLLAVQLVSRLRQALSVEVALGTVFDAPVLSALAERLEAENTAVLPPIPLTPRDGRIALSLAQQRLWFLTQLEGVSEAYHMSGAVRLDGPLNREVLQRALNRIVMRHEALRTCFAREEGEPIQVIQPHADLTVSYHDLREAKSIRHEAGNREQRAKDLSQAHASAPFDLSRDLPVRVLLLQLADEAHVVQVVMHHIASDGWSVGVFLQELSALYGSFIAEQGDPLAPLPLQYADYAAWQRRWLASGQLEKQGAFWQTNLSGAPTLLELPTDRPRPPKQLHAGASVEVKLGAALSERVKRLSQRHGVTPYMTLLSSWAAVLSRLSGQEEVVIGSPVAGRNRTEVEPLIGFFVNTLALRLDLSSEPTVGELLKRTKAQVLSAQAHQDLPFDQVVERVKPPRSTAHPPLFQVMFVWQNAHEGSLQIPGLRLSTWGDPLTMAPFELTLAVREHQDDIACTLTYATSLFDRATVERYLGHWLRQLDAMATDADPVVTGLPLLGEAERAQVLHGWNETGRAYARDACLHQLFEAQVSRTREAAAVICGDETLSYTDLDARANRLAHYLRGQGVGPDTRVGLALGRGVEMMTGLLAILKAGGAYVPLDPGYASERLRAILDDSRPAIVLADAAGRTALDALAGAPPIADLHADASRWSALPSTPPRVEGLTPRHLAYVIYTSGSTGQPKGVMVEHASVVNLWRALDEAIYRTHPSARRVSLNASIAFDSLVKQWVQLLSGRTLVVVPEPVRFDGRRLLDAIGRDRIDVFDCTPSQLALIEGARGPEDEAFPQVTLVGGEAIGEGMWSELASASSRTYYNVYGPTECTVDATLARITAEHAPHIGGPLANVRAYVLNERLSPAPVGVRGELYIGGAGVARGYLNRPELTRERFIDDPFVAGGRLYRTGDLARWRTDGSLEYLGRNDFQVKIRGFRIELGEIEAQLAKVTGVREVVVLARDSASAVHDSATEHAAPDALSPSLETSTATAAATATATATATEKRLVAYYTGDADVAALRAQAAQHLPSYMVPSAYVRLDAWPLTPNGKLDRRALPAPADDAYARAEYEAPQGAKEEALAEIWRDLLQVDRISRHDNFFQLGGHSLLAISLGDMMRERGLHADVRTLFNAETLAALAAQSGTDSIDVDVPPNLIPVGAARITPDMLPLVALTQPQIDAIAQQVDGGATNVQDIYPLAPLQEGMLFHHLLHTQGDLYLEPHLLAFRTRERLERFLSALQCVIDRHDVLRTGFFWEGVPQPVQVVWRRARLPVEYVELPDSHGDVASQLEARCDPRRHRIDIGRAPLVHCHVAHDARNDRWVLGVLTHHLVSDHTTLALLAEEAQAFEQGRGDALPPAVPFRNFVAHARLGTSEREHEAFFREMLGDVDEPTAPFGLLDVQGDGSAIVEHRRALAPGLSRSVRAHARRLGVSAASVMHVAWSLVLARTANRRDVVFGTVLFGRMQGGAHAHRTMGLFMNTLPVRIALDESDVETSLIATHDRLARLLRHEHAPLALAQRCSAVPAQAPLFTSLLNYRYSPHEEQGDATDDDVQFIAARERNNYPLTMIVDDTGEGFALTAQVDASIDAARVCAFMHTALEQLVRALDDARGAVLAELDVLPADEHRCVVSACNDTDAELPGVDFVDRRFEAQAARTPEAIAVACGAHALSYAALNRRANRLAHYLRAHGAGPERVVALALERSVDMMVGLLGILKSGSAYLPLDPAYPAERLAYIVDDARPALLLTEAALRDDWRDAGAPVVLLDADGPAIDACPDHNPDAAAGRDARTLSSLAYVIYTSGSTGRPKGVMIEHRNLANLLGAMGEQPGIGAHDVLLAVTSLSFDIAALELFLPLLHGARAVIAARDDAADPARLAHLIESSGASLMQATPSTWRMLAQHGWPRSARPLTLLCGGEALPPALAERLLAHVPAIWNLYGPTETTVWSTVRRVTTPVVDIGGPIANTQVYVLDERLRPAPIGVAGELYIGGAGVARGYLNRPELTRERFVDDPFRRGGRLYRTGDLARRRADGNLEYLGRNDFQVKIRGFRIELGEIEAQLAKAHGVQGVALAARDTPTADKRLVAYYVGDASAAALREHAAARLPAYMVPAAYVRLAAWPLTPNGKLDRAALPAPDDEAYARAEYEAPRGEHECKLAAIWRAVLQVERIGRHDDFFELGGHSLLAVRAVTAMRDAFGSDTSLRDLFARPVLKDLAEHASTAARARDAAIPKAARGEPAPMSFAQQRLWFLARMGGLGDAYHMPIAVRLRGALDVDALQRALSRIVSRHDALRTTFALEGEQPVQRVHADDGAGLRLRIDDLRGCADAGARRARILAGQASEPFDLARGPLVRGALVREADDVHTLCVTIHHIVSDGWSIDVFCRELSELYRAFAGGRPDPLPPLPVQYADYAAWQQRGIGGAALHAQAEYWRDALAGAPTLLELPTDRPRPPQPDYAGATVGLALDAPLTAGLRALARRHGATLFMTVFAAWSVLLSRLSRQTDVVIGTPSANRGHAQIEGLIGFFVNTIALRVDLDGAPTVAELLARVKARTLAAQQHQDIPFEHVVERVQPARSLSHSPVFQAMFAWQHASRGEMRLEGLRAEPLDDAARTIAKFDLTLSLRESGDAIDGGLEYASALFERATIERFAGYLRRLLEGMVADDTQRVDALPMLSRDERRDLIERRNATARPYPANSGVHRLFEAQAARTPDATAIVDGATTLDYRALDARANRIAHALAHAGVRAGDRVALHLEPSIGLVAAQLAVLKLGAAYVPVDVGNPPARKAFVAQDSGARLVLGDAALDWPAAAGVPQRDLAALLAGPWPSDAPARAPQCGGDTPAYVMYTSGSSGQPKGVLVTHRGIARLAVNSGYATFDASDRFAFASNPAFDASTFEVWTALLNGASIGIVKRDDLLDLGALAGKLSSIGVTCLFLTTALFNRCVSFDPAMFARLRCVISGGERADPAVYRKVMEAGPPRHLLNAYGPTETTTFAAVWEAEPRTLAAQAAPIGRPIGNTSVYVLDAYGAPVPVGVTGEIHIGGPGVAQGYLNRPALSAERFVRDPFVGGDARMYRTGDLGRWRPDGMLDCIGRADFQVKIRGFRIELGEIEACLLEHGALAQAAVLARDDGGDGGKTLVAYYVPRAGHEDGAPALRAHLAARLPEYMVPAAYVRLPAMPLTPNGKLERRALPAPDERSYVRRDYAAPQGEIETTLARIWAELFGIERVGRHDGFFELGGHSLLAVRMVARVHDVLGVEVPLRALFADPVLHVFASAVARASTRQASSNLVAFRSAGTAAPLFFIHSGLGEIGFVGDLLPGIAPEIPVYGFAAVGFLAGETPHATIEEMAAQYVDAMRRVQPHGPYRLAGWCAGGNIAFEMAHQLIAADETVEFLCMIDSPTSAPIDRSVTACVLARIPDDIPEALRTRLHALGDAFDVRGMLHACQAAGMLPIDLPTGLMERHVAVQYAIKHAKLNYVPPRLPVDVIHFVAQDEPMWRNGWAMDGWHDVADRVICLPASGDHMTMVAAPHAEQLGRRITEALAVHGGPRADGAERGYAPRIAIQTAPRDARAPTLFCIPGAGASVTTFSTLARHLPATFSVDGLQPRGLCGTMVPYLDVETAARAYLRSIRKAAPRGPYHLVGHSFGGWVAYEIACRLQEQGERVATLMLLDTERPGATDIVRGRKTRVDALAKLVELYEMHLGRPLGVSRDDLAALAHDAQIEHLRAALVRAKILPPSVHPNVLLGVVRVLEMNVNTPYRPAGLYAGTMHVVLIANAKADADLDAWRDEQAEQWRGLADDVRIVRAGGNHMTMLQPPHAASIAALLERTAGAPARLAQVH